MLKKILFQFFLGLGLIQANSFARPKKIVGLVAVHNEASLIKQCLQAMSEYTDAIVVLDDVSSDNTLAIVKSVAKELNIEKIIQKEVWIRDERGDKDALLKAGRQIGGTHFIMLDADEMFVASCSTKNWLRNQILSLKPGQVMCFPMINVWDSLDVYRDDEAISPTHHKWRAICAVLCDDGQCNYDDNKIWGPSGIIHVTRIPANRICNEEVKSINITDLNHGLLHYKYVNLEDIEVKKVWYMCIEYINANKNVQLETERKKNAKKINDFYLKQFQAVAPENIKIKLSPVPKEWYQYSFFDQSYYEKLHKFRKKEVIQWLKTYGKKYFEPLDIWQISWVKDLIKDARLS